MSLISLKILLLIWSARQVTRQSDLMCVIGMTVVVYVLYLNKYVRQEVKNNAYTAGRIQTTSDNSIVYSSGTEISSAPILMINFKLTSLCKTQW